MSATVQMGQPFVAPLFGKLPTCLSIAGVAVYVAADVGPAVVGLLRPRIVVPGWLTELPDAQQALVIAHELSHLKARDPQALAAAIHKDLPKLQVRLADLGAVQSIQLLRVSKQGMDVYEVKHERGSSQWSLALDAKGILVGAFVPLCSPES
jgi:hypothetical protein